MAEQSDWKELYPFKSHELILDGHRYHYLDEGVGPVLLMVHGNPTWSFYWRNLVLAFRGRCRVVVPDHVGCGLSDKPQSYNYTLAQHIENLQKLIVQLDLQNITLLAHDWGGAIGLGAATKMPERFGRFVLFNTAAFRDVRCPFRIRLCRIPLLGKLAVQGFNGFARSAISMATAKPERFTSAVKAGYLAPYNNWANRIATHRFVLDIPLNSRHPTYHTLRHIEDGLNQFRKHPVQLIWGMQDWCFTPHFLERFQREFFPDAETHRLEDAGHYVVEDDHERIVRLVEGFLAKQGLISPPKFPSIGHKPSRVVNVARRLSEFASIMPESLAVVAPRGPDAKGKQVYDRITFSQLNRVSDRLARGFHELGVPRGSRMVLMVPPGIHFIAMTFALFKAGMVTVLIDPGMGRKHLIKCLQEVEPEGFVGIPKVHWVRQLLGWKFPLAKWNIVIGKAPWWCKAVSFDHLRGGPWSGPQMAPTLAEDPAAIIFTSGSTGPPKGVLYRHGNFDAQVQQLRDFYNISTSEVNLPGFPLFALFDAAMGVTTVVPDMNPTRPADVNPEKILDALETWKVTQAFGSPAMWNRIGEFCEDHQIQIKRLKRVLSAGAPVPLHVLEQMKQAIHPKGDVHTPYGATEALPVASIAASDVLSETADKTRSGAGVCVGRKFPGIDWKVIEMVEGPIAELSPALELPTGQIGELIVRGAVVTTEYYKRAEHTQLSKIPYQPSAEDDDSEQRFQPDITGTMMVAALKHQANQADADSATLEVTPHSLGQPTPNEDSTAESPSFPFKESPSEEMAAKPSQPLPKFEEDPSHMIQGEVWHRMGDVGYLDEYGRFWFCGRMAHRVRTSRGTMYTIPCEAIFNEHPDVYRSALVGVGRQGDLRPVIVVEPYPELFPRNATERRNFADELLQLAKANPLTTSIADVLFHPSLPVDIRHNSKIFREKLAIWAARRVRF